MKKFKIKLGIWLALVGVGLGWWFFSGRYEWNNDIRLVVLGDQELGLVSISPDRRMINMVKVEGQVSVWIPGGLGWYPVNRLKKIVHQEGSRKLVTEVAFYNFGFVSERLVEVSSVDDWERDRTLLPSLGWKEWLRFRLISANMLPRTEVLSGSLVDDDIKLDDMLVRDLADSQIVNEEMRLVVINASREVGMANFIAKRLEWSGLTVTDIDKSDNPIEGCKIVANKDMEKSTGLGMIRKWWGCELELIEGSGGEVELYLGDKLAKMLNYSSYNQSPN